MKKQRVGTVVALAVVLAGCTKSAGDGGSAGGDGSAPAAGGTLKVGQTMPYSGPASAYGTIGKADQAYFKMINEQGGVNGHKIELLSVDDAYSGSKTVEATRKLVESDNILIDFGSVGTAPNAAVHSYLNDKKVPQLFVASGGERWADPAHPVDPRLAAVVRRRVEGVRQVRLADEARREDVRALPERRLRQGHARRVEAGLRRAVRQDRHQDGVVRGDRSYRRFADRDPAGRGLRHAAHCREPQVRRAVDPKGVRHRVEAAASHRQRRRGDHHGAQAGGSRQERRARHRPVPEGPERPPRWPATRASRTTSHS